MSTITTTSSPHAAPDHPWIGAVNDEFRMYSGNSGDYTLGRPIGFGASSTVYAATYHCPDTRKDTEVALKVVDLDKLPQSALKFLKMETQLMSLSKHPNVLRVRGTWLDDHKLYIALRLMRAGSISDCMRYKFPAGMDEESIRCILKQALEGLNYLHVNGFIHRDIKAANLLIDDDGTVLVGDLGVSASLTDEDAHTQGRLAARRVNVTNSRASHSPSKSVLTSVPAPAPPPLLGKRKSFVGTPCWMAPEVISQKQYDSSADIWSLGITALELAQGRAPHSRDPSSALSKILNNDPPTLDRKGGVHRYSRAFAAVIALCLRKEPSERPSAAQLLASPFFRAAPARPRRHLVLTLLAGLPPLADRQERRRQPSIASHPTASSWDFSMTTHTHITHVNNRRSSASVSVNSRSRSRASVESATGPGGPHFRSSSLRIRRLSIGDDHEAQDGYDGGEEGGNALVLKGRKSRDHGRTRGQEEAVDPLLVSDTVAARPHVLVSGLDSPGLDTAYSDDEEEAEANGRHLGVDIKIKSSSVGGSGSGSATGSTMLEPEPLAPPSSASLSSASSPEDLATPPLGTTPSSRTSIKMWRRLRGAGKTRKDSSSSVGTSRLSGFFGAVLERNMSRK